MLPRYFPEFTAFLDSVEQIDMKGKVIKLAESHMYRNGLVKNYNRIEITVTPDYVTLNGRKIDPLELEHFIYRFIKKYAPNYMIIYNADDRLTFKYYIEYLDMLWTQIDRLRNEMSHQMYNKPFDDWQRHPKNDTIMWTFPRNIIEWSAEEQRLNELIRRAG